MAGGTRIDGSSDFHSPVRLVDNELASVPVETKAVRVDTSITPSNGDLKLTGAIYFATHDVIWDKPAWFGLVKKKRRVTYGFSGGLLRVRLVDAEAPIGKRYGSPLEERAEVGTETSTTDTTKGGIEGGGESGLASKLVGKVAIEKARTRTSARQVVTHPPTVVTKGDDREPEWEFSSYDGPLLGFVPAKETALATLAPLRPEIAARAQFIFDAADVICTEIYPPGKTDPKRLAVLTKAFPRYLLEKWGRKDWRKSPSPPIPYSFQAPWAPPEERKTGYDRIDI